MRMDDRRQARKAQDDQLLAVSCTLLHYFDCCQQPAHATVPVVMVTSTDVLLSTGADVLIADYVVQALPSTNYSTLNGEKSREENEKQRRQQMMVPQPPAHTAMHTHSVASG